MSRSRGLLLLALALALAMAAGPAASPPALAGGSSLHRLRTPSGLPVQIEVLRDDHGPLGVRSRIAGDDWRLPLGDAVLLDETWWTPLRQLGDVNIDPLSLDPAVLRRVREQVAPAATKHLPDRLIAVALGDVTLDGQTDLVLSFRRPFRRTLINTTRPRRYWVDADGQSAHLGLYRPADLSETWVAGTLVAPIVELAACDGALAVAYGRMRKPGIVETGAWRWVVFGFLPTTPLPGPGTPICVDIDGDGLTEPAIIERSDA